MTYRTQRKDSTRFAIARQAAAMAGQAIPRTYREGMQQFQSGLEMKRAEVISDEMCWIKGCELPARKDDQDGLCLPHRKNVDAWKR